MKISHLLVKRPASLDYEYRETNALDDKTTSTLDNEGINESRTIEKAWSVGTEDVVVIFTFILALIFLVFLGVGWLNNRASTSEFMQAATTVISVFLGIVIGVVKADRKDVKVSRNKFLDRMQWVCLLVAVVISVSALVRTF